MTPPPCFTSVEPVSMEMSPFENLLIEHPRYGRGGLHTFVAYILIHPNIYIYSMSVYHSMRGSSVIDPYEDDDMFVVNLSGLEDILDGSADAALRQQAALTHEQAEALVEAHPVSA